MCLAVPMRIEAIDGYIATCVAKGVERQVNLFMLQDELLEVGDHVVVHVGYAIQKVSRNDAELTWELFDRMLAADA
jgi:hydrogenase expression/formation protein HypC